ncbi:hypothetical protein [Dictyobacter kobayashii]|uniref:Uncharacterized protein n=1 Tax=Dictyobacter kobayashii TaxID=2014872 RepID=A0A402AD32_9CHLR|nr:hypothetical protein [Dictyobacter kobayashii]GCE16993.1 hypothetical protein KDK_07930 [Dictyobacter kobayashii]
MNDDISIIHNAEVAHLANNEADKQEQNRVSLQTLKLCFSHTQVPWFVEKQVIDLYHRYGLVVALETAKVVIEAFDAGLRRQK